MPKEIRKRFPADTSLDYATFLNDKKIDGELYALLQSYSMPDSAGRTVVIKKNLPPQKELCKKIGVESTKTFRAHLKYLIEKKYVLEEEGLYILPQMESIYFLIPLNTIKFLNDFTNENVFKIYIYLGQRYNYKKDYEFTLEEIAAHIGVKLNNNLRNYEMINNALTGLKNNGLITYKEIKNPRGYSAKKIKTFNLVYKGSPKEKT